MIPFVKTGVGTGDTIGISTISGGGVSKPITTRRSYTLAVLYTSHLSRSLACLRLSSPPRRWYSRIIVALMARYARGRRRSCEHSDCSSGVKRFNEGAVPRVRGAAGRSADWLNGWRSQTFALAVKPSLGCATLQSLVRMLREFDVLGSVSALVHLCMDGKPYSCLLRSVVDVHLRKASDTLLAYLLEVCYTLP